MTRSLALVMCMTSAVPAVAISLADGAQENVAARKLNANDCEDIDGYEHMGCFNDAEDDRVFGHIMRDDSMTTDACNSYCAGMQAAYMGLQYGNECWCSMDAAKDFERHGVGLCDEPCGGDSMTTCGGDYAFELYALECIEETHSEYVGCYRDMKSMRLLSNMVGDEEMTTSMCRTHCDGYNVYATQYGNECWCGNSDPSAYEETLGVCHMQCAGDSTSPCGGYLAFSLYEYSDGVTAEPTDTPVAQPTPEPASASSGGSTTGAEALSDDDDDATPLPAPYDGARTGDGTYYGTTSGGNCGFKGDYPVKTDGYIPMAYSYGGNSEICGACVQGSGSGSGAGADPITGDFKGFIMDKCSECATSDLDFSKSGDGRWDIEWEFVECPYEEEPYFVFEGSNNFYWKISPRAFLVPVTNLYVNGVEFERTDDNYFEGEFDSETTGSQVVKCDLLVGNSQEYDVSRT